MAVALQDTTAPYKGEVKIQEPVEEVKELV